MVPGKHDPQQVAFDAPRPAFVRPQLAKLVTAAPGGELWAQELKFDGYRIHARIDRGEVQLITARSGLDWTTKYPATATALKTLSISRAYIDGEAVWSPVRTGLHNLRQPIGSLLLARAERTEKGNKVALRLAHLPVTISKR